MALIQYNCWLPKALKVALKAAADRTGLAETLIARVAVDTFIDLPLTDQNALVAEENPKRGGDRPMEQLSARFEDQFLDRLKSASAKTGWDKVVIVEMGLVHFLARADADLMAVVRARLQSELKPEVVS